MKNIVSKHGLSGRIKVSVVENGKVVREYPWQENLILDQGMDMVATTLYNQLFVACAAGTGTNPTNRNPGATATSSGTTVTAAANAFFMSDVGADIVFVGGQFGKIAAYVSPTVVTLSAPLTISSPTNFIKYFVNQTGLQTELKRTHNYVTIPGGCGSTITGGAISLFRTFIFTPEATTVTYSEIGLSNSFSSGANLFSRILLNSPVTVQGPSIGIPLGQQLQVMYQLTVNFDYGSGAGNFFPGVTNTNISITNLPIQYSISAYANSTTNPGKLAVTISGNIPFTVGANVAISGSSISGYNGTFVVLGTQFVGFTTVVTVGVAWGTTATGGNLATGVDGFFFRACQGIFLVGSAGQSTAPFPTPNVFVGYDEPSVVGQAWLSSEGSTMMGSNGTPTELDPASVSMAAATTGAYTAGNFFIDKQAAIIVGVANVSSFGFGAPENTNQIITYCWNQTQALIPTNTLSLTFRTSWGRMLAG